MGSYLKEYDETNPISIETYAKKLIGKTYGTIKKQYFTNTGSEPILETGIGRGYRC